MEKDTGELLRIKKKYSPKYILIVKMIDWYIVFGIIIVISFIGKNILTSIGFILILLFSMFASLVLGKLSAKKTYLSFYENKVVYKRKFLFININRELKYNEIKDIVFTQGTSWLSRTFERIFKFGNVYVYPKKGNIITNGMQLEVVENIEKVMLDIKTVVGDKIE